MQVDLGAGGQEGPWAATPPQPAGGGTSIHQRLSHVCTRSLIYSFIRGDSPEGALMAPVGTDVPEGSLAFRRRREKGWYSLNPMEIHSEMKTGSVSEGVCYGDAVNTTHGGGWLITLRHNRTGVSHSQEHGDVL